MDIREVGKVEPSTVEEAAEPQLNMKQGRQVRYTGHPGPSRARQDHTVAQSNHMLSGLNETHTLGLVRPRRRPPLP